VCVILSVIGKETKGATVLKFYMVTPQQPESTINYSTAYFDPTLVSVTSNKYPENLWSNEFASTLT